RRWLRDDTCPHDSPVRVFITGLNNWCALDTWPPPDVTLAAWFLDSAGRANSLDGDGRLASTPASDAPPDVYVHDPTSPVPTVGPGPDTFGYEYGPYDRRLVHLRQDVLVYTSAPLEQPLVVLGEPEVALWVATSGVDADFVLHLSELFADGRARTVSSGVLRA